MNVNQIFLLWISKGLRSKALGVVAVFSALASCTSEQDKGSINTVFEDTYSFEVVDTLKIKYLDRGIKIVDVNRKNGNILFSNFLSMKVLVQADSTGKVINEFKIGGEGDQEAGTNIFNAGYLGDTALLVNSNRGFFIYSLEGKLLSKIEEKHPALPLGTHFSNTIVREIPTDTGLVVALHLKSNQNTKREVWNFDSEAGYEKYKSLTLYNLNTKNYTLAFGYEPESVFMQDKAYFGDPKTLYDYNYKKGNFYVLHEPDPRLYIYSAALAKVDMVELQPENFPIQHRYRIGDKVKRDRRLDYVNSKFTYVNSVGDLTLVNYHNGVPEEEYDKSKSDEEAFGLFAKYTKYYAIVLLNNKKVSHDVELPYGAVEIPFVRSADYMLMRTHPGMIEAPDGFVFYVCKLIKKNEA